MPITNNDPCLDCGVCCQVFQIAFSSGEVDSEPGGFVPEDLVTRLTPLLVCMKGTESGEGRCIALQKDRRCGIYTRRPMPCRAFPALLEDGSRNPECLRLRDLFEIGVAITQRQPGA